MRDAAILILPLALLSALGCASTAGIPEPFPRPAARPSGSRPSPIATTGTLPASGYSVSGTALGLRGTPYRDGGTDPSGFDCSGFIYYVFAQHGIAVPRTVEGLYRTGTEVGPSDIRPGDLLFFATAGSGPSHVGIAIGTDQFVHAPSTSGVVRVERFSSGYWGSRFVSARRVTNE